MAIVLDRYYSETNKDDYIDFMGATTRRQVGVQIKPTVTAKVNQVKFYLSKAGTPADSIYAQIWSDGGDTPNAQVGADSAAVSEAGLSSYPTFSLKTFTFATPISLLAGTKYWIVLSSDQGVNLDNHPRIGVDASSPSYELNRSAQGNLSTWGVFDDIVPCFYEY